MLTTNNDNKEKIKINVTKLNTKLLEGLMNIKSHNISNENLKNSIFNFILKGVHRSSFQNILDELSNAISSILQSYNFDLEKYMLFIADNVSCAVSEIFNDPVKPINVSITSKEFSRILYRKLMSHTYALQSLKRRRDYILYFMEKSKIIESQSVLDKLSSIIYNDLYENRDKDLLYNAEIIQIDCNKILTQHNILESVKVFLQKNLKYNDTLSSLYRTKQIVSTILGQMHYDTHEIQVKLFQHNILHILLESNYDCSNSSKLNINNIFINILEFIEYQLNNINDLGQLKSIKESYDINYKNFELISLEKEILKRLFISKKSVRKENLVQDLVDLVNYFSPNLFVESHIKTTIENILNNIGDKKNKIFEIERRIIEQVLNKFLKHFNSRANIHKFIYPRHENASIECF